MFTFLKKNNSKELCNKSRAVGLMYLNQKKYELEVERDNNLDCTILLDYDIQKIEEVIEYLES